MTLFCSVELDVTWYNLLKARTRIVPRKNSLKQGLHENVKLLLAYLKYCRICVFLVKKCNLECLEFFVKQRSLDATWQNFLIARTRT